MSRNFKENFTQFFKRISGSSWNFTRLKISGNFVENLRQCLGKFNTIFKVIFTQFLRNFAKFLKDFQEVFKRFSRILGKNFTQFLRKFYAMYICDFLIYSWSITQKFIVLLCFLPFSAGADRQPLVSCVYPKLLI